MTGDFENKALSGNARNSQWIEDGSAAIAQSRTSNGNSLMDVQVAMQRNQNRKRSCFYTDSPLKATPSSTAELTFCWLAFHLRRGRGTLE